MALEAEETSSELTSTFSTDIVSDVFRDIKRFLSKMSSFQSNNANVNDNNNSISRLKKKVDKLITTYNVLAEQPRSDHCQICSRYGHVAANCRSRFDNTLRNPAPVTPLLCQLCNKKNHLASICPTLHNKHFEPSPLRSNFVKSIQSQRRKICKYGRKPGHLSQDCFKDYPPSKPSANQFNRPNSYRTDPRNARYFETVAVARIPTTVKPSRQRPTTTAAYLAKRVKIPPYSEILANVSAGPY